MKEQTLRLVRNSGTDRIIDLLDSGLAAGHQLDVLTPEFSLFAFSELLKPLASVKSVRFVLPDADAALNPFGKDADRPFRNQLQTAWLAKRFLEWADAKAEIKLASDGVPQGTLVLRDPNGHALEALLGALAFTTEGLGITPGNALSLITAAENEAERDNLKSWFEATWNSLQSKPTDWDRFLFALKTMAAAYSPMQLYALMLHHLFASKGDEMDEEKIVKSATGIRETKVWKKLYKFQRDAVIGAIDKLNRYGGCIIADSVGLGKTFEALAVIKYHELRNDRCLVLCPKRLRDNWTIYKSNDRRNSLASDRFNHDVLNHTDLSRDGGKSGDIDLAHVNWGNYDLVVIDESHNFRNKRSPHQGQETRYDRLMRRIIKEGVKTRVLMLSATPVNNRLADLRNQISFATEGKDSALSEYGIASIDRVTQLAQKQFNQWLDLDDADRTPAKLVDMIGFDYFNLLDLLTIARSRRHIEKYYGTSETGRFPDRLRPINIKAAVDRDGAFQSIREINLEIKRFKLASYAPMSYLLPGKEEVYEKKYGTELSNGQYFRQLDREKSLIHLLRVNLLKRMESAVPSFAQTLQRQLQDVEATLARIDEQAAEIEEIEVSDVDFDDPTYESLLVGRKVKVRLKDVDLVRWKQDLIEDRSRLSILYQAAQRIDASRDAKLEKLREVIATKVRNPINPGNRKVLVFTAFADTAKYLYENLAGWIQQELGLESALVTGSGGNQTTLPGLRKDLASILTAFSPRSKERPTDMADEGEIDLLIATDCISEGQNLQDCDWLINYDIHWNPVRIIQRFGRIDRIGSHNTQIQLVNFWPNIELDEYINLEQRVSGRMTLLDTSATGEDNLLEVQSGNQMNDLEYRRTQLLKLQDAVIDMEDLSAGVSISDLTLTDFRQDLAEYLKQNPGVLENLPLGVSAVTSATDASTPPGIIFCLRAVGDNALNTPDASYPLAPHYLIHVGMDGTVLLTYSQAKLCLDRLKYLSLGKELSDSGAMARWNKQTRNGEDMTLAQRLLGAAIASIAGKTEEKSVASLFNPEGSHALKGEIAGAQDFEVVAFIVIMPPADGGAA
jgi:hypothetical protein